MIFDIKRNNFSFCSYICSCLSVLYFALNLITQHSIRIYKKVKSYIESLFFKLLLAWQQQRKKKGFCMKLFLFHSFSIHCLYLFLTYSYIRCIYAGSLRVCSHALINSWMSISIIRWWRYIIISKSISIFYSLNYSHSTGKSTRWCVMAPIFIVIILSLSILNPKGIF